MQQHIKNMTEVRKENEKTRQILGITDKELKKLLLTYTHSELRTGLDLDSVLYKKVVEGNNDVLINN